MWAIKTLTPLLLIIGALEEISNFRTGEKEGLFSSKPTKEESLASLKKHGLNTSIAGKGSYGAIDFFKESFNAFTREKALPQQLQQLKDKQANIVITNNVLLDGNQVAESVVTNSAFGSAVDDQIGPYLEGGS